MSKKLSNNAPAAMPSPEKNLDGGPDDYEANNAFDNMQKAHEHMQDPAMMARVQKVAGRKTKALAGISAMSGGAIPSPDNDDMRPISSLKQLKAVAAKKSKKKMTGM